MANSERQARKTAKRRAAGLVQVAVWVPTQAKAELRQVAGMLAAGNSPLSIIASHRAALEAWIALGAKAGVGCDPKTGAPLSGAGGSTHGCTHGGGRP